MKWIRFNIYIICMIYCFCMAGCSKGKSVANLQKKIEIAKIYMNEGDKAEAISVYNEILKQDPTNVEANIDLGYILFLNGEINLAEEKLRTVIITDRNNPKPYFYLAELYRGQNRYAEALCYYNEVLKLDPSSPAHFGIGVVLESYSDLDRAEAEYNKHLSQHPNDAMGWKYLGYLEFSRGKKKQAFDRFTKVIELNPSLGGIYNDLGSLYENCNMYEEALKLYKLARNKVYTEKLDESINRVEKILTTQSTTK